MANARIVFLKQLCRKKELLLSQGLMKSSYFTVSQDTTLGQIINEFTADRYSLVNVLGDKDKICKTLSETEIVQGMMDRGLNYPVREL